MVRYLPLLYKQLEFTVVAVAGGYDNSISGVRNCKEQKKKTHNAEDNETHHDEQKTTLPCSTTQQLRPRENSYNS